jgi:hypothetical protein
MDGFDRNQVHFSSYFGLRVDGRMQRGPLSPVEYKATELGLLSAKKGEPQVT